MKLMQENMLMAEGILSSSLTLHTVGISFLTAVSSGAADYPHSTLGQREAAAAAAAAAFIVVRSAAAYCVVVIVSGSSKLPFSSLLVHCLYWTLTVEIIRYWSFVVDGDTRKCCSRGGWEISRIVHGTSSRRVFIVDSWCRVPIPAD